MSQHQVSSTRVSTKSINRMPTSVSDVVCLGLTGRSLLQIFSQSSRWTPGWHYLHCEMLWRTGGIGGTKWMHVVGLMWRRIGVCVAQTFFHGKNNDIMWHWDRNEPSTSNYCVSCIMVRDSFCDMSTCGVAQRPRLQDWLHGVMFKLEASELGFMISTLINEKPSYWMEPYWIKVLKEITADSHCRKL